MPNASRPPPRNGTKGVTKSESWLPADGRGLMCVQYTPCVAGAAVPGGVGRRRPSATSCQSLGQQRHALSMLDAWLAPPGHPCVETTAHMLMRRSCKPLEAVRAGLGLLTVPGAAPVPPVAVHNLCEGRCQELTRARPPAASPRAGSRFTSSGAPEVGCRRAAQASSSSCSCSSNGGAAARACAIACSCGGDRTSAKSVERWRGKRTAVSICRKKLQLLNYMIL